MLYKLKKTLGVMDTASEWSGWAGAWLCAATIVVMNFEVVMRYVFNEPQMWTYDMAIFLGGVTYALAWSYTQRHRSHIRVDMFYTRLSPRGQAMFDALTTLLIACPLVFVFAVYSADKTVFSWITNESAPYSHWFPPFWPVRALVALGFFLLLFQSMVNFIRDLYFVVKNKKI